MTLVKEQSKKAYIIEQAARLFRDNGFRAVSMRDLASAVGMEASSLYNHISNKQEILKIICLTIANRHTESMKMAAESSDPMERIESLIRFHIGVITTAPQMAAVSHDDWRHLDEETLSIFISQRKEYESTLRDWLNSAKQNGQLRIIDIEVVLYTLLSSIQWLHHWFRDERAIPKEKLEEEMVELLLNGLKK